MIQELKPVVFVEDDYNKNVSTVSQYGYIDMRVAYATGVVPSSLEDTSNPSNGIDEPSSIIGRPDDIFSVKRAFQTYKDVSAAGSAAPSDVSPEGGNGE